MNAVKQVNALLDLIDTLKQQHRSGETPTFGQTEDLFEYAADIRLAFAQGASLEPPAPQLPERAGVSRLVLELPAGARAVLEGVELTRVA